MRTNHPLSDDQVLQYLCEAHRTRRCMPTIREVARRFGHSSPTSVQRIFARLMDRGDIERDRHRYRLATDRQRSPGLPVLGRIAAGQPIEALEEPDEYVDLESTFDPERHFGLLVQGDSMIEAGIITGDVAVIRRQVTCETGDIVAAVIDGEATLKRFVRKKSHVELQPANQTMQPMIVKSVEIRGVMVGLVRRYAR